MAYPVYEGNGGIADGADYAVVVPWPSGVAEDDILVVIVGDADNDSFDVPSSETWAKVAEHTTTAFFSAAWYWHRVTAGEESAPPASTTFTSVLDAGSPVAGVMLRFSGCTTNLAFFN